MGKRMSDQRCIDRNNTVASSKPVRAEALRPRHAESRIAIAYSIHGGWYWGGASVEPMLFRPKKGHRHLILGIKSTTHSRY